MLCFSILDDRFLYLAFKIFYMAEKQLFIFGHSLVLGMWDSEGGWANRLKRYFVQERLEEDEDYFEIYILGVADEDSSQLVERIETEIENRLYEDSEQLIFIQIGANDIQKRRGNKMRTSAEKFRRNMKRIIEISNKYGEVMLVSDGYTSIEGPVPDFEEIEVSDEWLKKYVSIQSEVSESLGVPFLNLRNKFSKQEWVSRLEDGFHPSDEIHEEIFEEVKDRIYREELI